MKTHPIHLGQRHPASITSHANSMEFDLPLDITTQTVAILAKRGVGKTYTAAVLTEELLDAGQHVVAIDPTGAWWGLKSSEDGERPAYEVVVFGGDHADIPLEETAGEVIARTLIDKRVSAVIDLSHFKKGQSRRFLADFFETLYRLNRNPVHLVCDEADDYAPQRPFGDEARVLGAMEDIVRRGRKKGIGCTLITQRPAVLNKNVLTQCEVLVTLRLVHPKDIAAIREWVEVHATEEQADVLIKSLPSLPIGEAWFWSPGWLDVLARVKVRKRKTYDSGATPKPGQVIVMPKRLAAVDVAALGKEIADTVQRVKADDPKALRLRIAELEREAFLKSVPKESKGSAIEAARSSGFLEGQQTTKYFLQWALGEAIDLGNFAQKLKARAEAELSKIMGPVDGGRDYKITVTAPKIDVTHVEEVIKNTRLINTKAAGETMPKAERSILTALVQFGPCTKNKLAAVTGYAVTGGGFNNSISALRNKESAPYIGFEGDKIAIMNRGIQALGAYDPLPTGDALRQLWLSRLDKAQRSIMAALFNVYPHALSKEALAAKAGYEVTGGGFNNALSSLRTLELINRGNEIKASDDLFQ